MKANVLVKDIHSDFSMFGMWTESLKKTGLFVLNQPFQLLKLQNSWQLGSFTRNILQDMQIKGVFTCENWVRVSYQYDFVISYRVYMKG